MSAPVSESATTPQPAPSAVGLPPAPDRTGNDAGTFLREFLRAPTRIGAVAPSSRRLAEALTAPVPERGDPVVVELGPGTGSCTGVIQNRLAGRGRHLAIELSPTLANLIAGRHPAVEVITGNATECRSLMAERGATAADVVVSGLPWASFPHDLQHGALDAVCDVLAPGGAFTTFAYVFAAQTPPARRFRQLLRDRFEEVVMGRTVLANLPPAFVYYARRPRS